MIDTFITEQFETHLRAAAVYRTYQQECRQRNLTPLSTSAFYQRIKQRSGPLRLNSGKERVLPIPSSPGCGICGTQC